MMTSTYKLSTNLNNNNFYIKRDDLLPFSFGGNKARKATMFFEDIKAKKCDTVITYGSSSSNHCRVVANMAKANGLGCIIISPEEDYVETANSKLVNMLGARVIKTTLDSVAKTIDETMETLNRTCKPYFIQGGGHGVLGTRSYVEAYDEICKFEKENDIKFDYIFHASGTGTTQAGLVAGRLMKKNENQKIIGISIARPNPRGKQVILDSLNEYFKNSDDYTDKVDFIDDYLCGGYGKYTQDVLAVVKKVFEFEGVPLNTTYTGKAFYGMENFIIKNNINNKNILFINTGGSPLFFDSLEELNK